ncbi:hypothetical protein A3862_27390 [Methylobacterium sp. XJLW]|uniref:hypothetical protein n=1 Tax=Methylobacterium sp. XJLW TaxID=739141 RepID=UPI000DAAEFEA|nr:hypothetical protein [Methylobacterium sp. XJLW]AWV18806.1 hypothetical protein A3862_27390 [Methylobacterium sp. XJLW]
MRLAFALVLTAGLLAAGDARAQLFLNGVQQPVPPVPCGAVPAMDTLNGSPGSTNCFVPRDATRPTAVQAANVITSASDGSWSVTWGRSFVSPTPVVLPIPINTGSLPLVCNVVSRSATGATGKCWQSTTTTLGGTLVGLLVNPFGSPAASAAVMVIGREPTQ